MRTREEFEPLLTGQKGRNEKASAGSASRLRYGSLTRLRYAAKRINPFTKLHKRCQI